MASAPAIPFSLRRDPQGQLLFSDGTHRDVPVVMTPAFPLSEPGRWLSLRTAEGVELALIEDASSLDGNLGAIVSEELLSRQFIPVVRRVHSASNTTTGLEISVETDRGATTLTLDADEHIRRVSDTRIVMTDRAGVRYLIPDVRQLDQESRHRLERFY